MTTRLEIIQRAQARIGDEPITSESDAGASTHVAIFDSLRDDLISRYPWTWATTVRRLTRLTEKPPAHWTYFYQLPSDMLGSPRAAYERDDMKVPLTAFEMQQNRLATNAEQVFLRFGIRPDMALWPGYFTELLTKAVMRELALSVREDQPLYDRLGLELYGSPSMMGEAGLYGQAKAMDAQSRPSPVIAEGHHPLIAARG